MQWQLEIFWAYFVQEDICQSLETVCNGVNTVHSTPFHWCCKTIVETELCIIQWKDTTWEWHWIRQHCESAYYPPSYAVILSLSVVHLLHLLTQKLTITTCKYSVMIKFLVFFYSFGIAYDFIDCVGDDVDVVSDSEVCRAFENLTFPFFCPGIMGMHQMLTAFSVTCRTSRSFWKFPTVSPTSVWLFTEWGGHCFWTNWTFKSSSWAPLRYNRANFRFLIWLLFHIFVPLL